MRTDWYQCTMPYHFYVRYFIYVYFIMYYMYIEQSHNIIFLHFKKPYPMSKVKVVFLSVYINILTSIFNLRRKKLQFSNQNNKKYAEDMLCGACKIKKCENLFKICLFFHFIYMYRDLLDRYPYKNDHFFLTSMTFRKKNKQIT